MKRYHIAKKIGIDITRTLTGQSDVTLLKLNKYINNVNYKKTTIITIILLVFFSFVMTKSFSSLLLNSYFKLHKVPYVESLEELLIEEKYNIAVDDWNVDYLEYFGVLDEIQMEKVKRRRDNYFSANRFRMDMTSWSIYQNDKIYKDIKNGQVVVLIGTFYGDKFAELHKADTEYFVFAKNKYLHRYNTHVLTKTSYLDEQQNYAYVYIINNYYITINMIIKIINFFRFIQVFECGLHLHHQLISKIVDDYQQLKYKSKIIKDKINYEESGHNIELGEFVRNDLAIVLVGLCLSAIVFLLELLQIGLPKIGYL